MMPRSHLMFSQHRREIGNFLLKSEICQAHAVSTIRDIIHNIALTYCLCFVAGIAGQQGVNGHHNPLVEAICISTEEPRVAIMKELFNDRSGGV